MLRTEGRLPDLRPALRRMSLPAAGFAGRQAAQGFAAVGAAEGKRVVAVGKQAAEAARKDLAQSLAADKVADRQVPTADKPPDCTVQP